MFCGKGYSIFGHIGSTSLLDPRAERRLIKATMLEGNQTAWGAAFRALPNGCALLWCSDRPEASLIL